MNAYSFGRPGRRWGRENRLSSILNTDTNNGSHAGGIGSVLAKLLIGLEAGQDRRDMKDADKAFSKGMSAKPWTPPDEKVALGPTGSEGADMFITREESMKRAAPAGGVDGALYALSQLEGNPHAGRFSRKLSLDKMEMDRRASEKAEDRAYNEGLWDKRLGAQTEKQKDLLKFRLENTPQNEPTESFSTPQQVQGPDGKPVMVQFGNRGTVRPVDGYQPVPDAPKEQGGPFAGTSMDAQANNILLTGDPASPVYKAAYNHLAQPRVQFDAASGQQITINPDMSAYAPPATQGGMQTAQGQQPQAAPTPMQEVGQATAPTATGQAAPQMPMPDNRGGVEISQVAGSQPRQKFTEAENKAAGFASRMEGANTALNSVMAGPDGKVGTSDDYDPTGYWDATARGVPLVGNALQSKEGQNYYQAMQDWVTANLRKESGAVIGVEEMENEITKYFPVPGDGPEVMAQKAESRRRAEAGMRGAAGPAYDVVSKELEKTTPAAAPQADFVPSKPEDMDAAPVGATFIQNDMRFTKMAPGPGGDKWSVEALGGGLEAVPGASGLR